MTDDSRVPERALRGHVGVLAAALEGDDHVALDVGERALALAVRIPREGAGPLTAPTRPAGEAPDRGVGADGSGEGADALVADVMQPRPGQQPDAAARRSRGQQALHCRPRFALVGIGLAERGHRFSPVLDVVTRYRTAISELRNLLSVTSAAVRESATIPAMTPTPTDEDYRRLLELRTGLRRFLRWSEQHADAAGLTPAQHQLLLAIRGHDDPRGPTVGDVAGYLMLRHHSAVGLVDRAEKAGLITRGQDAANLSVVRLHLSEEGARLLEALSEQHLDELAHLAPTMHALWDALEDTRHRSLDGTPHPAAPPGRDGG